MLDSRNEHTINNNCDGYMAMDPSAKNSQHQEKFSNLSDLDGIQFEPSKISHGDESGFCSPPLWSKSPPRIPVNPKFSHNKIRNSPPSLRVQAIARGQKELMEMVKAMPESLYELSLKDLVDHQKFGSQEDEIVLDQEKSSSFTINKQGSVKKQPSLKKKMARTGSNISESNNKGLFLKMGFPMPFEGNNKKVPKPKAKAKTKENPYAKVSTKLVDNNNNNLNDKSSKSVNPKDWCKSRYSDSESGGLSSNASSGSSGSSASNDSRRSNSSISNKNSRKIGGLLRGCSPFHFNTNKTVE